jgi:phosphohistidine phosphatase
MTATSLYFLRHGDAGDKRAWPGRDAERPLSELGAERTNALARHFERTSMRPNRILTSPYARALQTADIVARVFDMRDLVFVDERLVPGFGITELQSILAGGAIHKTLLVGHDPSFSSTIRDVIGGGVIALRKGGLARLDLDDVAAPRGRLVWLITPSLFGE